MFTRLQRAVDIKDYFEIKLFTRMFADLVNASVLLPESIIALFDALLAGTQTDGYQAETDARVEVVLATLPWVAMDLSDRCARDLERTLSTVAAYMGWALLISLTAGGAVSCTQNCCGCSQARRECRHGHGAALTNRRMC